MSTYDPGEPYDGPPPRRRRRDYRHESEEDDAWAAASEDARDADGLSVEDLAAGYVWEDRDRYGVDHDAPDDDNAALPRPHRDDPRRYTRSPSYHRDRARRGEYAEYWGTPAPPKPKRERSAASRQDIPFWQILILVILVLFAVLAVTLACASVLALA